MELAELGQECAELRQLVEELTESTSKSHARVEARAQDTAVEVPHSVAMLQV